MNIGRRVFIFVLLIRNKSLCSGKIIIYLKIERMSLNVGIGNMVETKNRDANHLRWQKSSYLGISVSLPGYRKMEHRET